MSNITLDKVMEWVEFLDEKEVIRIHDLAQDRGLGELDFYEWVHIDSKLAYNHAAESTSMDAWIARQLKEALEEMRSTRSQYRSDEIEKFANWLWDEMPYGLDVNKQEISE